MTQMPAQEHEQRVSRLEGTAVFLAGAAVCLVAGLAALRSGRADLNALAALSHALDVVHKEPRLNLALIGFVDPPLPALLYLPFCGFSPVLAASGLACPLLGAVLLGLCAVSLNGLGAQAGLPRLIRWALVAVLVLHPVILSLAALGSPGILLAFCVLAGGRALMRWSRDEGFRDLLTCSLFLTAAVLTRYEALTLALTAVAYVGWRTLRAGEGWARTEGTLIALLLPLLYCGAVWVGANWAIMGDPWNFWHALSAAPTTPVSGTDWATAILWVALLSFPPVFGVLYHELRGVGPRNASPVRGRAGAWLLLGALLGAALTPRFHTALGEDPWSQLLTVAVCAILLGLGLLAVALGGYLQAPAAPAPGAGGRRGRHPVGGSVLLTVVGILVAGSFVQSGQVALPAAPAGALRGEVAFAAPVAAARQAADEVSGLLAGRPERKAYVLGEPGFAVSLFSGRPRQIRLWPSAAAAWMPLEEGDVIAVADRDAYPGLAAGLRQRYLHASPPLRAREGWAVYRVSRPTPRSLLRGKPRSKLRGVGGSPAAARPGRSPGR